MASWDPCSSSEYELPEETIKRIIRRDMRDFKDGKHLLLPSMHVYFDEEDMSKVHVLSVGEIYTPYEGGFFYFLVRFPANYAKDPPKVKLMNTVVRNVRFNPNIYRNGKVCHGILGTFGDKSWESSYKLLDVLEVIQSILSKEYPFKNEPYNVFVDGQFPDRGDEMERYNDVIRHETLRVAVCDVMEGVVNVPVEMKPIIEGLFHKFYPYYLDICEKNGHLQDISLDKHDPFSQMDMSRFPGEEGTARLTHEREGQFDYRTIHQRLLKIKEGLDRSKGQPS